MRPLYAFLFFLAGTIMLMLLYRNELLLFGLMSACALACLHMDKWKNAKRFLAAMLIGGTCENIAVMIGGWHYSFSHYLYAPLWLPVGWGMAYIFLCDMVPKKAEGRYKFRMGKDEAIGLFLSLGGIFLAFSGSFLTSYYHFDEMGVLIGFIGVTVGLFIIGFYRLSDIKAGLVAASLGTGMESLCIIAGNWHYMSAVFRTPMWLPLCWFNAFLIMSRTIDGSRACS